MQQEASMYFAVHLEAEYVLNCATTKRLGYDDSYQAVVSHKETLHLMFL
jgi:hypothetical protein